MYRVFAPTAASQSRTRCAVVSAPLSLLTDVRRHTALHHDVHLSLQHVLGVELARRRHGQGLARVLIHQHQDAEGPAIMSLVRHEVVGPHLVRATRAQSHTGPVCKPESGSLGLLLRHLESLLLPEPLHPAEAHRPALAAQHAWVGSSTLSAGTIESMSYDG